MGNPRPGWLMATRSFDRSHPLQHGCTPGHLIITTNFELTRIAAHTVYVGENAGVRELHMSY